ncbi:MAG: peptide synthase [Planctomycetia bacterium]|nr:peptide synthase [Planctomycetia bacterium]
MSENIAAALKRLANEQPDATAMIHTRGIAQGNPYERRWTYRELDDESDRLARGLMKMGLTRGMRTVLMVPPSLEFYSVTFALFKLGAIVVLIDPGMGIRNLGICIGEAAPEAFIGVTKAHVARLLFGWGRSTIRLFVTVGWRCWGGWSLDQVRAAGQPGSPLSLPGGSPSASSTSVLADTNADDMAAILFTSGSTGVAKGVVYTHSIFNAQVRSLRELYGIEPGEIDLPTFPLFGLFGPALGFTSVLPEMDATRPARVDPRAIFNAIERYGVTNLFGSPALLRRIAFSREADSRRLPTLRRVLSAGAPVPSVVLQQMNVLLGESVPIYTPYGATEALPVSNIGHRELLDETAGLTSEGRGVCVGRPIPGMEIRIISINDETIETWSNALLVRPGEIGEVVVRGPIVTRSYYARPLSTALHKIQHGNTFWHRMGDVGYLDDKGRLWFCGRKSHRVVTSKGTLYTIPCEGVFNAHPAVLRTALVGVRGEPVLCIELDPKAGRGVNRLRIVQQLREMGNAHQHTRDIRHFFFHPAFPVDIRHNAKIFREKLAAWAAQRLVGS